MSIFHKSPKDQELTDEERSDHNLLILGVIATAIAIITTGVSLYLYHASGDVYLDRSRPGFLPDEQEAATQVNTNYKFKDSGAIDKDTLDEYLENFDDNLNALDALETPFSATPLSDESLGLLTE